MESPLLRSPRNRNLDLLRASAILMVIAGHLVVQSPVRLPWLKHLTDYGQYGVDLFFVLSGWLIGSLYWRENRAAGNVAIAHFWIRRWLRTIPPYLVTLAIAALGAYLLRRVPFDFGYLLFIQNYYDEIPFFLISWSLCVEEHFYLVAPLLFLPMRSMGSRSTIAFFLVLCVLPTLFRLLEYPGLSNSFSYTYTASHLRMDGLAVGCFLSYLAIEAQRTFQLLSRLAPYALAVFGLLLFGLARIGGEIWYVLWGVGIALFFAAALVLMVSRKEVGGTIARLSGPVALASYSLYLTHAWGVTLARDIAGLMPPTMKLLYFPVAVIGIGGLGALFYVLIERTSIGYRDAHWPRRSSALEPGAQVGLQASH